jgi:hypothetical protein
MAADWTVIPTDKELIGLHTFRFTKRHLKEFKSYRPKHSKMPISRNCKQQIYEMAAEECKKERIKGNCLSLTASFCPEIFLTNYIKGRNIVGTLTAIEYDKNYGKKVRKFNKITETIFNRYLSKKIKIETYIKDIFDYMLYGEGFFPKGKYSIIDLDLMTKINDLDILVEGIVNCSNKKCQVLLWSPVGRFCFKDEYRNETIPAIKRKLEDRGITILDHKIDYYLSNRIPMYNDRFILIRN